MGEIAAQNDPPILEERVMKVEKSAIKVRKGVKARTSVAHRNKKDYTRKGKAKWKHKE